MAVFSPPYLLLWWLSVRAEKLITITSITTTMWLPANNDEDWKVENKAPAKIYGFQELLIHLPCVIPFILFVVYPLFLVRAFGRLFVDQERLVG